MDNPRRPPSGPSTCGSGLLGFAALIQTAKLNGVEPQAWLTDVLERIVSGRTKNHQLDTLMPWNWEGPRIGQIADTA